MRTKEPCEEKKYFVFLGSSGFPYGLAAIQKIILISKSLTLFNNSVTVICNKGIHSQNNYPTLLSVGKLDDIEYIYTCGSPFRNEKFIKRNLMKFKGLLNELKLISKRKKNDELNVAIVSTTKFSSVLYYFILSKIFHFKTALIYVEFYSNFKKKWFRIDKKINDKLYDRFAPILSDTVLPISEFLIDHLRRICPSKKYLKMPGLTDFDRYANIEASGCDEYFLYCGAASYMEVIKFIIDSYNKVLSSSASLYLVSNGTDLELDEVRHYIALSPKKYNIKLFSKLSEKQLFTCYKGALALLIPLRPTVQDIARFPHKTGEYLASGNPVISTNFGEIKFYFNDKENMLIAEDYDTKLFAEKMQFVIENPELAKRIGLKGENVASILFDYKQKAKEIDMFFNSII